MTQLQHDVDQAEQSEPLRSEITIDLEGDFKLLSHEDLNKIGQFCVYDEAGNRHAMSEIWTEFKTIFVFVRVCLMRINAESKI